MEGASERHERLLSSSGPSFEGFFRLYTESMPLRERKPRTQIEEMIRRPDYEILSVTRGKTVIGYGVSYVPIGEPCALLEYMAVHGAARGAGVGGRLLQELVRRNRERGAPWMLAEVDSEADGVDESRSRSERHRFYRRHGCLRIDALAYVLPLPGDGPPPAMDLLVLPPEAGGLLRKADLSRWLESVFVGAYGCQPNDLRIARMLATVGDPVRLV